jgi:hypothetical protein
MEKEVFIVSIIGCGLRRFMGVKNHLRHQPELEHQVLKLPCWEEIHAFHGQWLVGVALKAHQR